MEGNEAIWSDLEVFRAFFVASWSYLEIFGAIWSYFELFGVTLSHMDLFGPIRYFPKFPSFPNNPLCLTFHNFPFFSYKKIAS